MHSRAAVIAVAYEQRRQLGHLRPPVRGLGARLATGGPWPSWFPIDEYDALEETADILADPLTLAAIDVGLAELQHDETVTLEDLRGELAERRPPR
jgi:hypothetical protein